MNPVEIEEAVSQLAAAPFDRAEFPFQFLAAFGNKKTTIDRLRRGNTNQSDLPGGVLQRSNIHIANCGSGEVAAMLTPLRDRQQQGQVILPPLGRSSKPKTSPAAKRDPTPR